MLCFNASAKACVSNFNLCTACWVEKAQPGLLCRGRGRWKDLPSLACCSASAAWPISRALVGCVNEEADGNKTAGWVAIVEQKNQIEVGKNSLNIFASQAILFQKANQGTMSDSKSF